MRHQYAGPGHLPAAAAATSAAAEPETAAGAQSAAQNYYNLYAAGQFAADYPMLSAAARAAIPESTFVTVHQDCKSPAAGLAYKVSAPTMAGSTAVMSVSLAGAGSALGAEEESFVYEGGQWLLSPSAADLASYKGTPAQIVAAFKAAGRCG